MFYCEKCRVAREWPKAWSLSHGKCECCGAVGACYDRPSVTLPGPPRMPTDTERLDFLIDEEAQIEVLPPMGTVSQPAMFRLRWPDLGEHQKEWYKSGRDAIDEAIAQERNRRGRKDKNGKLI